MNFILALDQGTTSSRAVLIDVSGNVVGVAQKEFRQIFPSPGLVEHDPKDIWSSQAGVVSELIAQKGISHDEIAAIAITNQRETTIVWDKKTGEPLMNAIVWQDRRTTPMCEKLRKDGLETLFREKTGLVLDPYFSATKLHWILEHIPGAREKAENGDILFGTVDTWLIWKLTRGRVHATDVTNASRTLLFNIHTLTWDEDILKIFNIPKKMLPEVKGCSEKYGEVQGPLFSHPIPICGVAGDQQAALFGQMCTQPGMAKSTFGTGAFLLMNIGNKPILSKNHLLTTVAYKLGSEVTYALEGSVFVAGATTKWLRDSLKIINKAKEMDSLAETVPDSGGVYFVPAFTGLGAPYWDPHVRGTIFGITRGTTSAHIARAAIEGVAFQVLDVVTAMMQDAHIPVQELRVDGGMVNSNPLMQFQADLIRVPIVRPKVTELTALGTAFLAGLCCGFWSSLSQISAFWEKERIFYPEMSEPLVEEKKKLWKKAVRSAKEWGSG